MRVNTGLTVSVSANTERWLSEMRAGRGFGGFLNQVAVAAQNSHIQLFNPVASGITVIVRLVLFASVAAQGVHVSHHNTALTTLGATSRNLLSGGAAPVAEVRSQTNAGELGSQFLGLNAAAATQLQVNAEWFTEVGAGEGVLISGASVNVELLGNWLWMEV